MFNSSFRPDYLLICLHRSLLSNPTYCQRIYRYLSTTQVNQTGQCTYFSTFPSDLLSSHSASKLPKHHPIHVIILHDAKANK